DVALIAAHGEAVGGGYGIGHDDAAVIDTAVAAGGDAVIEFELEILRRAAAPDEEGVAADDGFGRNPAGHDAVGRAPVFRIALPALQRLAIKHGTEARLITFEGLRTVGLFRDKGLGLIAAQARAYGRGERGGKETAAGV